MRRRSSTLYLFLAIVALTALAGYIAWPGARSILGRQARVVQGLDLQGGLQVLLRAPDTATAEQVNTARQIVEQRVNGLGLSEPLVQRQGSNRIAVELPGVRNPEEAIRTFQGTGLLEFVDAGQTPLEEGTLVNTSGGSVVRGAPPQSGAPAQPGATTTVASASSTSGPATTETAPAAQLAPATGTPVLPQAAATPAPTAVPPGAPVGQTTVYVPEGDEGWTRTPPEQLQQVYPTIMTGTDIREAQAAFEQQTNHPVVSFTLSGEGASKFGTYTTNNVNSYLAIVLDKKVVSSPQIQQPITQGNGQITGVDQQEAQSLALQLRYGSLPIPLTVESSNTIGATLGQDSIDRSITAGILGVIAVALFMILYYRLPGLLAVVALAIYSTLVFAIFKLIPVTLTLAGIAGFVLSIGMAVDANVLIFARMKEELRRGRGLLQAVDAGFKNAWPSIRDSNISTLITCAVLLWFGSLFGVSIIRGFALTLVIGVLTSMFTAIIVTRTLLGLVVKMNGLRNVWLWGIGRDEVSAPPPRPGSGSALGGSSARAR